MKNIQLENNSFGYSKISINRLVIFYVFLFVSLCLVTLNFMDYRLKPSGFLLGFSLIFLGILFTSYYYFSGLIHTVVENYSLSKIMKSIILIACLYMLFYSLNIGYKRYAEVKRTNYIHLDIPLQTYGAIKLLSRGDNPYAMNALVANIIYAAHYLRRMEKHPHCLKGFDRRYLKYFNTHFQLQSNKFLEEKLVESLPNTEECLKIAQTPYWTYPLNFIYGPVMMGAYFPFVYLFKKPGMAVCNLFFLSLLFGIMLIYFRENNFKNPIGLFLFTFLLCRPDLFNYWVMQRIVIDIVPVFFMLVALIVFSKNKKTLWFPFFMALSVASKLGPGIVLTPILLMRPKKEALFFVLILFLFFFPFLVWDYQGLYSSQAMSFNFMKGGNTLLYNLYPVLQTPFKLIIFTILAYCTIRLVLKNKSFSDICLFVFLSIVGMLLVNNQINNNYIVWVHAMGAFCLFVWTNRVGFQEHQPIQYPWVNKLADHYCSKVNWNNVRKLNFLRNQCKD